MKEHRPTSDTASIPEKERPSVEEGRSDVCIMRGFMSADAARHTHVLASRVGNGGLVRGPTEYYSADLGYCSVFGALWGVDMSGKRKRRNELFLRKRVMGVNQTQPHAVDARL